MKRLWKHYRRIWSQHTTLQFATLLVLIATYSVVGGALLIHQNLDKIFTSWGNSIRMSVYLDDELSGTEKDSLLNFLNNKTLFEHINFVSKDQALKEFTQHVTGYSPSLLFDPTFGNPLPASFELELKSGIAMQANTSFMKTLAKEILSQKGVEDISYGQGWVENYASVVNAFTLMSWLLTSILLGGSLLIVGNSIRSSLSQRKEEIEIMELVGATPSHIRGPFIFEGFLQGLIAVGISLSLIYLIFHWQVSIIQTRAHFWSFSSQFEFLSPSRSFLLLFFGAFLGIAGSYFALTRISQKKTPPQAAGGK